MQNEALGDWGLFLIENGELRIIARWSIRSFRFQISGLFYRNR